HRPPQLPRRHLLPPQHDAPPSPPRSFPTRRSSDLRPVLHIWASSQSGRLDWAHDRAELRYSRHDSSTRRPRQQPLAPSQLSGLRSEEHTSELQSRFELVCRLLLEKKKTEAITPHYA